MATAINRVFPAEPPQQVRESDAQPIAVVLDELLARYQARFPARTSLLCGLPRNADVQ